MNSEGQLYYFNKTQKVEDLLVHLLKVIIKLQWLRIASHIFIKFDSELSSKKT